MGDADNLETVYWQLDTSLRVEQFWHGFSRLHLSLEVVEVSTYRNTLRFNILSGAARVARQRYPRSSAGPVILFNTLRLHGFLVLVIDSVKMSELII